MDLPPAPGPIDSLDGQIPTFAEEWRWNVVPKAAKLGFLSYR